MDSSQTALAPVPVTKYPAESDITIAPIPVNVPVEGGPATCGNMSGDHHVIVIDRNTCAAYEYWQAAYCSGGWTASVAAVWDFTTVEHRPYGYTSVDAAGLSVFEGLVRYDEVLAGSINHAIRFTAQHTKDDANLGYFTAPATHAAGNLWGADNIMGMRIRLKASFDVSSYSATNQIILNAMKKYGMILADNGGNLFFQGTPDARWNASDLNALKAVPATAFDVVQMGTEYDTATAPKGAAPVIASFTASPSTVSPGTVVTLIPVVTGASYSYIDKAGFVRYDTTVTPTETTTYTLTSRNAFGTSSASTTVTVTGGPIAPSLVLASIPNHTFGDAPFQVLATSNSPGAITYSIVSGPATISGTTVTLTGAGTVVVKATQAASGNYSAATVTTSFTVAAAQVTPTIAFSIANQTYPEPAFVVSATSNSPGAITYSIVSGPATISGATVTLTGTGTVVVKATQAASGNYSAGTATASFTVSAAGQTTPTIAFSIANQTYPEPAFVVSATSNSPGAITYSIVSGPATISGATVTLTGTGAVVVQATQAASGTYSAGTATASFTVSAASGKSAPKIVFAISNQTYGASPFHVRATSNSGGSMTYSIVSGPAKLSGEATVTLTGVGTVVVQAMQPAYTKFTAGSATATFTVSAP